jgi:UDP-2-acetamido-3-amino-2,3-dideoxy-glucuronate N-acetyltransferase
VRAVGCAVLRPGVADSVTIELEFPSGRTAEIGCSSIYAEKRHRLTVVGEQAFAVFDDTAPWHEKVALHSHAVDWSQSGPRARRGVCEFVAVDEGEPLQLECRHFLDCIVNGRAPVTDGAEGRRVIDVLIAAEQSLEMNAPVRLAG